MRTNAGHSAAAADENASPSAASTPRSRTKPAAGSPHSLLSPNARTPGRGTPSSPTAAGLKSPTPTPSALSPLGDISNSPCWSPPSPGRTAFLAAPPSPGAAKTRRLSALLGFAQRTSAVRSNLQQSPARAAPSPAPSPSSATSVSTSLSVAAAREQWEERNNSLLRLRTEHATSPTPKPPTSLPAPAPPLPSPAPSASSASLALSPSTLRLQRKGDALHRSVLETQLAAARDAAAEGRARLREAHKCIAETERCARESALHHAAELDGARDALGMLEVAMKGVLAREASLRKEREHLKERVATLTRERGGLGAHVRVTKRAPELSPAAAGTEGASEGAVSVEADDEAQSCGSGCEGSSGPAVEQHRRTQTEQQKDEKRFRSLLSVLVDVLKAPFFGLGVRMELSEGALFCAEPPSLRFGLRWKAGHRLAIVPCEEGC